MLSRLAFQRVISRVTSPYVSAAGLRMVLALRQQAAVRTFLTTAHVAQPAARDSKAKKSTPKKVSATKSKSKKVASRTKKVKKVKKVKKATKAKVQSDDPDARFKGPLLSVKIKKEERPPTKPPASFFLFLKEQFALMNKEDLLVGGAVTNTKGFAQRWQQMSDSEKQPYREKADTLREEHQVARRQWFEKVDPRVLKAINAQRKNKKKPMLHSPISDPRKPLPAFLKFMQDIDASLETIDKFPNQREYLAARGKATSEKWNALSEEERKRYCDEYNAKLKEYTELLEKEKSA